MPRLGAAARPPGYAAAAEKVASFLAQRHPEVRVLSEAETSSHESPSLRQGWRLDLTIGTVDVRTVDVLIDYRFPFSIPRVALVEPPPLYTWPHVEPGGLLCQSTDVSRPDAVLEFVLDEAATLIGRSMRGETQEHFRTEFMTYWARIRVPPGSTPWRSLAQAGAPSRMLRVWKGKDFYLVGDDDATVYRWLAHFFGHAPALGELEAAAFLWLAQPLLPREYPGSADDMMALACAAGPETARILEQLADQVPERLPVLLGARSIDGPCLAGITITRPQPGAFRGRQRPDPLTHGVREGHAPGSVRRQRYLAQASIEASSVTRIDPGWIHGRDRDERQEPLAMKCVVVLGCGSLGAPMTFKLAAGGVGNFVLVDSQALTGPNTSRHELGSSWVGRNKALGIRDALLRKYPHLGSVTAYPETWQEALARNDNLFTGADLVVLATGDWHAEAQFNDWHLRHGRVPVAIYAWVEPRAGAGHGLAIGPAGGCLQCGFDETGDVKMPITIWPPETMREREPGCGAVFQPYGPAELAYVEALASELAVEVLLDPPRLTIHRMWAASRSFIERSQGALNPAWVSESARRRDGCCREEEPWPSHDQCVACGRSGSE